MALLILGVVVLGFSQTYFFAGMLRAKLPNTLVHIHGAIFVSWIFFLVILTSRHLRRHPAPGHPMRRTNR